MLLLLLACTGDTPPSDDTATPPTDSGLATAPSGCHAAPRAADDHALLVSFPYDANAGQSDLWRLFAFDGAVGTALTEWSLGRAIGGRGAWTPDGATALVTGTSGQVSTVHLESGTVRTTTEPYVSATAVERSGELAWLVDGNWPENGGGLYRATLDCDTGHLGEPERVWSAKNAAGVWLRPGHPTQAAVVARELDGIPGIVHFVDLESREILSSVDAFGDDEAIVSDAAWDHEGQRLLVADNGEFSAAPTRVAVVDVDAGALQVIEVEDPVSLVTAPWAGGDALVVSGYGDGVFALVRTANGYDLGAKVASLALPGAAVGIRAGGQLGQVVVVENTGLWGLSFSTGGGVADDGRLVSWDGLGGIPGGIALQP